VPRYAAIALPRRFHPLLDFCHACRVAVVLPVDGATTVITRDAVPVEYANGSPVEMGCGGRCGVGRCVVGTGDGACVVLREGWGDWWRDDDDAAGAAAGLVLVAGGLDGVPRCAGVDVQAARLSRATPTSAHLRRPTSIPPGCHATPMRIRGCADGVSHCMIETRSLCGIATQPAVALPSVTCRKNALPAP